MSHKICKTRRSLLKAGMMMALTGGLSARSAFAAFEQGKPTARGLAFYNLHTGESLKTDYWVEGAYLSDALADINHILRDYRNDQVLPIEPRLLDLLHGLRNTLDTTRPIQIISGYRSPATNALLAAHSDGVAKGSLHMQAKAIDLHVEGVPLNDLRRAAIALNGGGVGYYPKSNFVHVDIGRVRTW
ncbi:peptidase M15 [mine drainage metagenome]|uniref:Murein endopeptidase K n=1 Tax=mine drainage metagenome TaxID=410659 RepID=A0A1J5RXP1_9ZZZZ